MTDPEKQLQLVLLLRVLNKVLRRKGKRKGGGTRSKRKKAMRARKLPERKRAMRERSKARLAKIIYDARTKACMDCGLFYGTECMEFDHRLGEKKLFCIGEGKKGTKKALLAEIAKTDVLCCECHGKRERSRGRSHGDGRNPCPNVAKRGLVQARPLEVPDKAAR